MGFIAFLDPPKKSVTETLRTLENYGIAIKIITGDNELVTQKIAQEINLPVSGVLKGGEIEKMHHSQLALAVEKVLQAEGFKVVLTRTNDIYPDLAERPAIAASRSSRRLPKAKRRGKPWRKGVTVPSCSITRGETISPR